MSVGITCWQEFPISGFGLNPLPYTATLETQIKTQKSRKKVRPPDRRPQRISGFPGYRLASSS